MPNRTRKGNVTAATRKKHGMGKEKRFPIFDKRSALAALKLRGHAKTPTERAAIIRRAAQYAPEAATRAREANKD